MEFNKKKKYAITTPYHHQALAFKVVFLLTAVDIHLIIEKTTKRNHSTVARHAAIVENHYIFNFLWRRHHHIRPYAVLKLWFTHG